MADTIQHQGRVDKIEGYLVSVRIIQTSACSACSLKGHCTSTDTKEKLIEVFDPHANEFQVGDEVWVMGTMSMGMKAVILSFVLPFVILFISLFVLMSYTADEVISSLVSLILLIPYYYILWLNRNRLKKQFSFTIKPKNN